ncbi:hypothetical protein ABVK25_012116 [Lepraria finkii]|uniref:Uncharacterized protein n=1 Tax=Lepraria finkii TaxID=1340010 RepID=A0ABR4AIV6_9LECA
MLEVGVRVPVVANIKYYLSSTLPVHHPTEILSRSQSEAQVRSWGFKTDFTWTDGSNAHYPPHSHSCLTPHLVRRGSLTITHPKDERPTKETFGVGDYCGCWEGS